MMCCHLPKKDRLDIQLEKEPETTWLEKKIKKWTFKKKSIACLGLGFQ